MNTEISGFFEHEEISVFVKCAEMQIRFRLRRGIRKERHTVVFAEHGFRSGGEAVDLYFAVPDLHVPSGGVETRKAAGEIIRQIHSVFAAENVAVENAVFEFFFKVHRGFIRFRAGGDD